MKPTGILKKYWIQWTLRKRILIIMFAVALLVALICAAGFAFSSFRMRSAATQYAQTLADNVGEPVRMAFYQQHMCSYSNMTAAQAAYLDAQTTVGDGEELLKMACEYGQKTFWNAWPLESASFLWLDGEFHSGSPKDTLALIESILSEAYEVSDTPGYLMECPNEALFTQDEDGYFLTWASFGEAGRIGMLVPSSECYDLTVALTGLLAGETGAATEGIRSATVRTMLMAFAAVIALLALFPLAAGYLAEAVSVPVEQEQARYSRELKLAEDEKRMLAELDRKKTEFLANVSHELKTPLTVVSSYAQSSAQGLAEIPETEKEARAMRLIVTEVNRMALLVNQLLDVTRIDEGRLVLNRKPVQIDEVIKRTLDTYAPILQQNGNRLVFNRMYDLPEIEADEVRIQQVLVNLLSNAAKHTRGGTISVSMAGVPDGVEISVADTGDGIASERLPQLFERFSESKTRTGRETGTGLGLFLCKHFVEAHGGSISIESALGEGTTVRFTLMK